jgi:S1-C subfamily serine protease
MDGRHHLESSKRWDGFRRRAGTLWALGLLVIALGVVTGADVAQAATLASGGPCTTTRRGIDLALPAVIRVATTYQAQLTYTTADGSSVTFPQDGGTYALVVSGAGAFISGTGDVLTASSAVSADEETLDQLLAERAAPDIAQALNDSHPGQTVTAAEILTQLLTDPQSWLPLIQQPQSALYLSNFYSGPTEADSLNSLQSYPISVVAQGSPDQQVENDLTILHVDGLRDLPTIALGDAAQVYPDDTLTIIGYPVSADLSGEDGSVNPNNFLTPSVKTVTVSALKTAQDGSQLIQIDGNLEQGDNGAPALNADGQVVGIVSLAAGAGNGAGQAHFLQRANDAQEMARQAKVNLTQDSFDKRWAAAYDMCASSKAGHWHDAYAQFTQLAHQYPNFKGVQPYLAYAKAQAAREPVPGIHLPAWAMVLLVVVLLAVGVLVFLLLTRRRRQRAKGTYAGYGPGHYETVDYSGAGYSPGSSPSVQQASIPVASEQIGVTVPSGGNFLPTQPDALPPSSELPPG